jgi:orotate phosphoribosyltransferase
MKTFKDQILSKGLVSGHFIFHSSRHALLKFEFDNISKSRRMRNKTAKAIAKIIADSHPDVDAVASIGEGANCLAAPVSRKVSRLLGRQVVGYETHANEAGDFRLAKGNIHAKDKSWVIIDDVFTKGTTSRKVSSLLHKWNGSVLGVVTLLNRNSEGLTEITNPSGGENIPVTSVVNHPMVDYMPEDCPMYPDCPTERAVIL